MADRTWADSVIIHNIAIIVAGAATCLLPLLKNAPLLFLFCIVFGVNLGGLLKELESGILVLSTVASNQILSGLKAIMMYVLCEGRHLAVSHDN